MFDFLHGWDDSLEDSLQEMERSIKGEVKSWDIHAQSYCEKLLKRFNDEEHIVDDKMTTIGDMLNDYAFTSVFTEKTGIGDIKRLKKLNLESNSAKHEKKVTKKFSDDEIREWVKYIHTLSVKTFEYLENTNISDKFDDEYVSYLLVNKNVELEQAINCASAYGINKDQVLKAYSVSIKKGLEAMEKASRLMSENYPQKPADSFDENEMDALYLVINHELPAAEAEIIVADATRSGVDIKNIDYEYLEMAKSMHKTNGVFSEKIPYLDYFKTVEAIKDTFEARCVHVSEEKYEEYFRDLIGIIVRNCSKEDILNRSEFFYDQIKWFIQIVVYDHWSDYCDHFSLISQFGGAVGYNYSDKNSEENGSIKTAKHFIEYMEAVLTAEHFSQKFPFAGHAELENLVIEIMKKNSIDQSSDTFIPCFVALFEGLTWECSRNDIVARSTFLINFITLFIMALINGSDRTGKRIALIAEIVTKEIKQAGASAIDDIDDSYINYLISWRQDEFRTLPLAYGDYLVVKEELDKINISVSDAHAGTYVKAKHVLPLDVIKAGQRIIKENQAVIENGVERYELIRFASCLINNYVDEDYVYGIACDIANSEKDSLWMQLFYGDFFKHSFNDYTKGAPWRFKEITVKLAAMIVAANKKCDFKIAEAIVEGENGKYQIGYLENTDWRFIEANIIASKIRPDQNYKYIEYNAFVKAAELISRKGRDNIFSIHELYLSLFAYSYGPYKTIKSAVDSVCSAFEKINYYNGVEPYWKQRLDEAIKIWDSMQQAEYENIDDSQKRSIEIITSKSNLEKIHELDIDTTLTPDVIRIQMSLYLEKVLERNILDIFEIEVEDYRYEISVISDELYEGFKEMIDKFSAGYDEKDDQYKILNHVDTIELIDYRDYLDECEKNVQGSFRRAQIAAAMRADCGIFLDPFDNHPVVFDLEDKDYTIPLFVDVEDLYYQYKNIHGKKPLEDLTVEEANSIWLAAMNI